MNTKQPDRTQPRQAECWLIASADSQRVFEFKSVLNAAESPLTAWRLRHGLALVLHRAAIDEELRRALSSGAPRVHLYADFEVTRLPSLLAESAGDAARTAPTSRVRQRWWSPDTSAALLEELARPDAPIELAWQHGQRSEAPALQADADQAPALGTDHEEAFRAWAASDEGRASADAADDFNVTLQDAMAYMAEAGLEWPDAGLVS